jgi:L-amino acid N-acyltransferase YncA
MPQHFDVRPAGSADLEAMLAIYEPEVRHGTATFEIEPPDVQEFGRRLQRLEQRGLPWLVAEGSAGIVAYAYAGPYHQRPAYGLTAEDSVYVASAMRGQGVGRSLLKAVVAAATTCGMRQMVALIGDSANIGSIRIHAACGFARVGTLRRVGCKFDRWLDVVIMQRAL